MKETIEEIGELLLLVGAYKKEHQERRERIIEAEAALGNTTLLGYDSHHRPKREYHFLCI